MRVSKDDLVICQENRGRYRAGYCAVCEAYGGLDTMKHKNSCPFSDPRVKMVEVSAVIRGKE